MLHVPIRKLRYTTTGAYIPKFFRISAYTAKLDLLIKSKDAYPTVLYTNFFHICIPIQYIILEQIVLYPLPLARAPPNVVFPLAHLAVAHPVVDPPADPPDLSPVSSPRSCSSQGSTAPQCSSQGSTVPQCSSQGSTVPQCSSQRPAHVKRPPQMSAILALNRRNCHEARTLEMLWQYRC